MNWLNKIFSTTSITEQPCVCGKHTTCVSKIYYKGTGFWDTLLFGVRGRLWREPKEFFQCGKVQNQIKQLKDIKININGSNKDKL